MSHTNCHDCDRLTTAPSKLRKSGFSWVCNLGIATGNINCQQYINKYDNIYKIT